MLLNVSNWKFVGCENLVADELFMFDHWLVIVTVPRLVIDRYHFKMSYSDCTFILLFFSLQFDPAPRRGETQVTRRTPDYFL